MKHLFLLIGILMVFLTNAQTMTYELIRTCNMPANYSKGIEIPCKEYKELHSEISILDAGDRVKITCYFPNAPSSNILDVESRLFEGDKVIYQCMSDIWVVISSNDAVLIYPNTELINLSKIKQ
jgi:hypothetical protein